MAALIPLGNVTVEPGADGGAAVTTVTCTSPTNIAVVKYWGKRDKALNLPINSSVSVTLDQRDLRTVTSVAASTSFTGDRLWLNGEEQDVSKIGRMSTVFREMRALAKARCTRPSLPRDQIDGVGIYVKTYNTFPTAAGLASSAAGYACLVYALGQLFGIEEEFPGELSRIARQGSGSASRSLYGGFVRWQMGTKDDGSDSLAVQVAPAAHWPEMEALILVASRAKKHTSSTSGMMTSVATSELLAHRARAVVPERLAAMESAYLERDFQTFGELTMRDSNQFHATCLDTYPPIFYMNDVSRAVVYAIHAINEAYGRIVAAYTFDAGPNAVVYLLKPLVPEILALLLSAFPPPEGTAVEDYIQSDLAAGASTAVASGFQGLSGVPQEAIASMEQRRQAGQLIQVLHSRVGPGPKIVDADLGWWNTLDSVGGNPSAESKQ